MKKIKHKKSHLVVFVLISLILIFVILKKVYPQESTHLQYILNDIVNSTAKTSDPNLNSSIKSSGPYEDSSDKDVKAPSPVNSPYEDSVKQDANLNSYVDKVNFGNKISEPSTVYEDDMRQGLSPVSQTDKSYEDSLNKKMSAGKDVGMEDLKQAKNDRELEEYRKESSDGKVNKDGSFDSIVDEKFAPSEFGMPKDFMAYNIGSQGKLCVNPKKGVKTVFAKFAGISAKDPERMQAIKQVNQIKKNKQYVGGYINPLPEKQYASKYGNNVERSFQSGTYGEPKFKNYDSALAKNYINSQLDFFALNANNVRGKGKSVVVDVDNCDSIGGDNYLKVLNAVKKYGEDKKINIKVFAKNPNLADCHKAMKHPVVIGFFIEEITKEKAEKLNELRAKQGVSNKPFLFARGGNGKNKTLDDIRGENIPNSHYSYDGGEKDGKEYGCVTDVAELEKNSKSI